MPEIQGVLAVHDFPVHVDVTPDTGSPADVTLRIGALELFLDRAAAELLVYQLDEAIHELVNDVIIVPPPES